jgi:hypothetical protein
MKHLWLVSIPVVALLALFAVRSSPTLAGPGCGDQCAAVSSDQAPMGPVLLPGSTTASTTFGAGMSVYAQVSGQYCSDKSGGQIFVPTGGDTTGLTCPAGGSMSSMSMGSMSMSTATPSASPAAAATGTPKPASAATATATATSGSH